jgi:hypothetical protein
LNSKENIEVAGRCGQWIRTNGVECFVVHRDGAAWLSGGGITKEVPPKSFEKILDVVAERASLALRLERPVLEKEALIHFLSAAGWLCRDGRLCPECQERSMLSIVTCDAVGGRGRTLAEFEIARGR